MRCEAGFATGCSASPWNCGDLLPQGLDVGELDGLPPPSGFNHVTLKTEELTVNLQSMPCTFLVVLLGE